jgi:hypothetical protein
MSDSLYISGGTQNDLFAVEVIIVTAAIKVFLLFGAGPTAPAMVGASKQTCLPFPYFMAFGAHSFRLSCRLSHSQSIASSILQSF